MGQVQKEGLRFVPSFQPGKRMLRKQISNIGGISIPHLFSINIKCRVVINTLSLEALPMTKARAGIVSRHFFAHMPFTEKGSLITCRLKVFREVGVVRRLG